MTYLTHLECAVPCDSGPFDPLEPHHLCPCGAPLLARYDFDSLAKQWTPEMLRNRSANLWRYREVLPLDDREEPVSLGEGFTPLIRARQLERTLGMATIYIKDESLNPTNSFKARGMSVAVTRARRLGAATLSAPSAGNAANALAAYAARAELKASVFMPRDVQLPFIREAELYGADVTLVDGLISDAGRVATEQAARLNWYDLSTLKEPYRVEGKKTLAYEIAEQLNWKWPNWFIYPTGGGTGLVGMWKACDELEQLGWIDPTRSARPRMVSVQATGCAPIVRAFESGADHAKPWDNAETIASGLRVPAAIGDFLILRAVRESGGTALAVEDRKMVAAMKEMGRTEGISVAPEGGATLCALRALLERGVIAPSESVVLFNTGGALKYLNLLQK